MEQPKISIIIPVYNVEPYLRRCLDSVIGQTYKNLEIILVDDGSTDGSGAVCDAYAARDVRVRVIHTENRGAFAARNRALDMANGNYIGFVDADDWLDTNMYQTLMSLALEHSADIAQCEMINEGPVLQIRTQNIGRDVFLTGDAVTGAMFREEISHGLINKIFHKKCFEGFRFDERYYHLDAVLLADVHRFCNAFARTDKALYHYNTTNVSITRGRKNPLHITSMEHLFDAYSAAVPYAEPEGSFFICREIPSGGRLILPSFNIPPRMALRHIRVMHRVFCRHWGVAKTTRDYRNAPAAKKTLWFLYRHFPVFTALIMTLYVFLKQCCSFGEEGQNASTH